MIFFFGLKTEIFKSALTIPRFQLRGKIIDDCELYSANINKDSWEIKKVICKKNNRFYFVDENEINNNKFFFLAKIEDLEKMKKNNNKQFLNLNNYTDTDPAYRGNFKIFIKNGGFSSFQSEYPYAMLTKKGSTLSPLSHVTNKDADYNKIFIRNIYEYPIKDNFDLFFINMNSKKVVFKTKLQTNTFNEIDLENKFIEPEIYMYCKNYLSAPIFVSVKNNHVACEHTHPLYDYIPTKDGYKIIASLKKELNEITN